MEKPKPFEITEEMLEEEKETERRNKELYGDPWGNRKQRRLAAKRERDLLKRGIAVR